MNTAAVTKQYLSVNEAAEILDMNHYTIRREIAKGRIKAYRLGRTIRIRPEDLAKALKPVTSTGA